MSFNLNTRSRVDQALRQARARGMSVVENEMFPAVVIAANGGGWDVGTLDATGEVSEVFSRVYPHPANTGLSVDMEVWLWVPSGSGGGAPRIFAGGGNGGGCMKAVTDWGILFG